MTGKRILICALLAFIIVSALLFLLFYIVSDAPKTPLNCREVDEILTDKGYECYNSTKHFNKNWGDNITLKAAVSVREENLSFDFFELDKNSIGDVKHSYDAYIKSSKYSKENYLIKKKGSNYNIFGVENENGTVLRLIVEDTMVYAHASNEKEIKELCTELGYYEHDLEAKKESFFNKHFGACPLLLFLFVLIVHLIYRIHRKNRYKKAG